MTYSTQSVPFELQRFPLRVNETFGRDLVAESREQFQEMLSFIGCCVKSYPDTIVLFSDWLALVCIALLFFDWLIGRCGILNIL